MLFAQPTLNEECQKYFFAHRSETSAHALPAVKKPSPSSRTGVLSFFLKKNRGVETRVETGSHLSAAAVPQTYERHILSVPRLFTAFVRWTWRPGERKRIRSYQATSVRLNSSDRKTKSRQIASPKARAARHTLRFVAHYRPWILVTHRARHGPCMRCAAKNCSR